MKRLIFILIPLLVSAVSLSAQTIEISGTVVDSDGETVIGAAVLVAGGHILSERVRRTFLSFLR